MKKEGLDDCESLLSNRIDLLNKLIDKKIINIVKNCNSSKKELKEFYKMSSEDFFAYAEGTLILVFEDRSSVAFSFGEAIQSLSIWGERLDRNIDIISTESDVQKPFLVCANDSRYSKKYNYWNKITGKKIKKFQIIKEKPKSIVYRGAEYLKIMNKYPLSFTLETEEGNIVDLPYEKLSDDMKVEFNKQVIIVNTDDLPDDFDIDYDEKCETNEIALLIEMEDGNEFIISHGLHSESNDLEIITRDEINPEMLPRLIGKLM